jgi:hypothetical protein
MEDTNDLSGLEFGFVHLTTDGQVISNEQDKQYLSLPFDSNFSQWQIHPNPKVGWEVSARIKNWTEQTFWPWRVTAKGLIKEFGEFRHFSQIRVRRIYSQDFANELRAGAHRRSWPGESPIRPKAGLRYLYLHGVNLESADLSHANLGGATFVNCNLSDARLEHAWLVNARFFSCNMTGANIQQAEALGASFENSDLQGANFIYTHVSLCNFWQAKHINLTGATSKDSIAWIDHKTPLNP